MPPEGPAAIPNGADEVSLALKRLKMKPLKALALKVGVSEASIEEADEADSVKMSVVELIVTRLRGLKNRELRATVAKVCNVDTDTVEDAMDEASMDPKGAAIMMLVKDAG